MSEDPGAIVVDPTAGGAPSAGPEGRSATKPEGAGPEGRSAAQVAVDAPGDGPVLPEDVGWPGRGEPCA